MFCPFQMFLFHQKIHEMSVEGDVFDAEIKVFK